MTPSSSFLRPATRLPLRSAVPLVLPVALVVVACGGRPVSATESGGETTHDAVGTSDAGGQPGASNTSSGRTDSTSAPDPDTTTGADDDESTSRSAASESTSTTDTTTGSATTGSATTGDALTCDMFASCEDQLAQFVSCGGDLVGTWDYVHACRPFIQAEPDPDCPTDIFEQRIGGADGTLTFTDSQYSVQGASQVFITHSVRTLSCQDRFETCEALCAAEARAPLAGDLCCEPAGDDVCDVWRWSDNPLANGVGEYSAIGTQIHWGYIDEYCVDGDTLLIASPDAATPWIHTYTRQRQ